jgi:hypothetical protein
MKIAYQRRVVVFIGQYVGNKGADVILNALLILSRSSLIHHCTMTSTSNAANFGLTF